MSPLAFCCCIGSSPFANSGRAGFPDMAPDFPCSGCANSLFSLKRKTGKTYVNQKFGCSGDGDLEPENERNTLYFPGEQGICGKASGEQFAADCLHSQQFPDPCRYSSGLAMARAIGKRIVAFPPLGLSSPSPPSIWSLPARAATMSVPARCATTMALKRDMANQIC